MADLIVPTAPISGGRAAQVRVSNESAGGAVAEFGQSLFNNGMKIRNEQDARELSQAQIDMQMQLGQLRQEFDNISDPTVLNRDFPTRIQEIRANLMGNLTERLQPRAGMAFDELANRHTLAIGARATDLHQSTMRANLEAARRTAVANAAGTDEATRTTSTTNFSESVVDAVTTGALTPEQAGDEIASFTSQQDLTAANARLVDDPAGLAEALGNGEYAGITGPQRSALQARASTAAEKAATQAAREVDAIAKNQLSLVITAANQGRIAQSEEDILNTPEFRDNPKFGEALAAVQLRDERPEMAQMTPAQLRAAIAEESQRTVANGYDNNRLAAMQSILKEAEKGWRDDPIARAQAVGLPAPAAPEDLANADPQALIEFFSKRATFANGLVEDGYTDTPVFFTAAERDQITAMTTPDQDPAARVEAAALLSTGFGDNAHQALANLGADPVFTHMAGQLAGGGNPAIAEAAFKGQQAIAAGTVDLPSSAEARTLVYDRYANLFQDISGGEQLKSVLLETATAIWASTANGQDAEGDTFETDFKKALSAALGASINARGQQTGGIQEIGNDPAWTLFAKGVDTLMPIGMTAGEFNEAWGKSVDAFGADDGDPIAVWRDASLTGDAPTFAGRDLTAEDVSNLHFRAVGDGVYQVFYSAGGNTWPIEAGGTGEPYWLDMRAFVEAMQQ